MSKLLSPFLAVLCGGFVFCSCSAKAQTYPREMITAFEEAGLPLLKQKVAPRDFSLPLFSAPAGPARADFFVSLDGLKGKVVFLNFWATWCGPCRMEMPSMEALYARYKDRGLEILAVNGGEGPSEVTAFMKDHGLSFPAVLDRDGSVNRAYGVQAIPTSYLIDREGKIITRMVGSIDWDTPQIHTALEHLLD